MNREEFEQELCSRLVEEMPSLKFSVEKIDKLQDPYRGIVAEKESSGIGICLNTDGAYKEYLETGDFDAVVSKTTLMAAKAFAEAPEVSFITDYEKVKPSLIMEVVSSERNKELLENTIHRDFLDLSLIIRITVGGKGSAVIKKAMTDIWGITAEQIIEDAIRNTVDKKPLIITSLLDWMFGEENPLPGDKDMLLAGTKEGTFGASVLCYPDFIEKAADITEGGFYIIPSSIHEVLIVPGEYSEEKSVELRNMVHEVNEAEVPYEDQLSESVYYCDGKEIRVA